MSRSNRQYELVLLGATGYTGKLTAEYISSHLPTDLKWAVAGRNQTKLEAVVEEISKINPDRPKPAIEVCSLNKNELDALAKKTRLIITTVGPFMFYGTPVLEACANNGTHYLDCTGEVPWVYDMIASYDAVAKRNGAIIIPQAGVDSVPLDLLSFVLARHIRKTLNAATASVTVTLAGVKGGFSGGTLLTATSIFDKYSLKHLGKSMAPYALSPIQPQNPTPPPSSSLIYRIFGLLNIPELGGIQTDGPMARINTSIVHRSWGLFESQDLANSQNTHLSYGPHFRYTEHMLAKNFVFGTLFHYSLMTISILLAFPPTRFLLTPLLRKILPKAGEGPSRDAMKDNFMSWRGLGVADTETKQKVLAEFTVKHGGYWTTGMTLAEAAMVILRGDLGETEAGRLGGGVLTPAMLGEEFVERLRGAGVMLEVRA